MSDYLYTQFGNYEFPERWGFKGYAYDGDPLTPMENTVIAAPGLVFEVKGFTPPDPTPYWTTVEDSFGNKSDVETCRDPVAPEFRLRIRMLNYKAVESSWGPYANLIEMINDVRDFVLINEYSVCCFNGWIQRLEACGTILDCLNKTLIDTRMQLRDVPDVYRLCDIDEEFLRDIGTYLFVKHNVLSDDLSTHELLTEAVCRGLIDRVNFKHHRSEYDSSVSN